MQSIDEWPEPFVRPRSEARLTKVVVFAAILGAPARGIERRKFISLHLRKDSCFFRAPYARLSKVVVFAAILNAPVRGM